MKTELESKRRVNWSELGNYTDNRNQYQELAQNSLVLSNPSTVFNAMPPMTAPSNPTANCQKCKIWKRTNQEVRNVVRMQKLEDIPQTLEMLGKLSELDSIRKTVPNLAKVLEQIKETISKSHSDETKQLNKEIFDRDRQIQDLKLLLKDQEKRNETI